MTPELKYLAWTSILSALIWIPYIVNVLTSNRLSDAVGYPESPLVMSPWAERLKKPITTRLRTWLFLPHWS